MACMHAGEGPHLPAQRVQARLEVGLGDAGGAEVAWRRIEWQPERFCRNADERPWSVHERHLHAQAGRGVGGRLSTARHRACRLHPAQRSRSRQMLPEQLVRRHSAWRITVRIARWMVAAVYHLLSRHPVFRDVERQGNVSITWQVGVSVEGHRQWQREQRASHSGLSTLC
jgi:hypothetical protein